jgi:cytochrome c biogenesis protein CcmG/thiol:disulfide interchange protein DsbE
MKILSTSGKVIVLIGILGLISLMGYAIFGNRVNIRTSPLVGNKAPEFTLKTFDGKDLKLSDLKGKTVLLNFWASWCMPCRQEAGALERSWQKYKDKDVVFIGVNVWDENSNALSYLKKFGGGYPHATDPDEEIQVDYGVGGVPETYFIGPSGNVRDKFTGPLTEQIIDYFVLRAQVPNNNES